MEPGLGGLGAAGGPLMAPLATPIGDLRLDPASAYGVVDASRRIDAAIAVPNDPSLVGAIVAQQAFGPSRTVSLQLGSAIALGVTP